MHRKIIGLTLILSMAALSSSASAQFHDHQWPQWRGPMGTGVAPHGDPPIHWSESKNVRWKVELPGRGHSSPVVWGDKVFVLTAVEVDTTREAVPEAPDEGSEAVEPIPGDGTRFRPRGIHPEEELRFVVLALDRDTGTILWEKVARTSVPHEGTHATATWASSSAATDGKVLIASFGSNGIYAYDLDGNLLWERDLGDQETRNAFGEGSSPALHGSSVIVNWDHEGDSFIVALDRDTGETRWRKDRDEPTSWATPLVIEVDGRAQVVVNATNRVRAYDLETGEVIWHVGGMTTNAIPTPAYSDGLLYVMSGFRGNALLAIRVAGARGNLDGTSHVVWKYGRDTSYTPSGLVYEDTLYFLKRNSAILSILDAGTGKVLVGPARLPGIDGEAGVYASPVGAAGRVYIAGQNGVTLVLARGSKLEILATNELDDAFDASPAIVGEDLFLRGRRHLYCLREPKASKGAYASREPQPAAEAAPTVVAATRAGGKIESVGWMAGCWVGAGGEECWLAPLGGTMVGINRGPEREGKQPAFEFLRIVERDGGIAFLASPGGKYPPVAFPAVELSGSRVVFANPDHDFPQRITYWLEGEDALRARVEAQKEGEWGGFEVTWKRGSWQRE